jgi:hypothetical protein
MRYIPGEGGLELKARSGTDDHHALETRGMY